MSASIFTPESDSLEARVQNCKKVLEAYNNVEKSLNLSLDKDWADRLGSVDEIQQAYRVTESSLYQAAASLKQSELVKAQDQGLLNADDVKKLTIIKSKSKLRSMRKKQKSNSKDGPAFKR